MNSSASTLDLSGVHWSLLVDPWTPRPPRNTIQCILLQNSPTLEAMIMGLPTSCKYTQSVVGKMSNLHGQTKICQLCPVECLGYRIILMFHRPFFSCPFLILRKTKLMTSLWSWSPLGGKLLVTVGQQPSLHPSAIPLGYCLELSQFHWIIACNFHNSTESLLVTFMSGQSSLSQMTVATISMQRCSDTRYTDVDDSVGAKKKVLVLILKVNTSSGSIGIIISDCDCEKKKLISQKRSVPGISITFSW